MNSGNNEFALSLYSAIRAREGNLVVSPFSVRMALGMALLGARGTTAEEMRRALHYRSQEDAADGAALAIIDRSGEGGATCELTVANRLWGQDDAPLRREFLDQVARAYRSEVATADFRSESERVRAAINEWVEAATRGKIRDLIPPAGVNDQTRLVLANAVHFKGPWARPFDDQSTLEQPFRLENGRSVRVPLMHRTATVEYMEGGDYQAVDLAYRGGDLAMLVLLPKRVVGLRALYSKVVQLRDLEDRLTAPSLDDCVKRLRTREVRLYIPRFRVEWGAEDLSDPLKALGMFRAFNDQADFSGINDLAPPSADALKLSAVFHKAFVEVNEEGTEAAAATAAVMVTLGLGLPRRQPDPPVFRADHPFLFAIRDRKTGAILFLGRVMNPAE